MCDLGPYRQALSGEYAARELRNDVKDGRFDADVVEAVPGAAGHPTLRRRHGPAESPPVIPTSSGYWPGAVRARRSRAPAGDLAEDGP